LQFRDCVLVHLFLEVCLTQLVMCKSKIRIHFDGLAALAYRFVVGMRNEQKLCQVGFDDQRQRIQDAISSPRQKTTELNGFLCLQILPRKIFI
jgi:hypothetical protein